MKNQMYDVLLEYRCPDIWLVRSALKNTVLTQDQIDLMKVVDPSKSCQVENNLITDTQREVTVKGKKKPIKLNESTHQKTKKVNTPDETKKPFTRFNFTLFSMLVSGSFLAGFSVKTFYIVVAYGAATPVRLALIFSTFKGFAMEVTDPMAIIRCIEACYMYRFENDLYNEEECYRMV